MRGILIIWSMLVFSAISMAQNPTYYLNPGKKLNQYNITTLTTDNGLPSNSLLHIYQAKNGYIWISGYSGLVRYNGTDFQVFNNLNTDNLESNVFRNIAEDSEGTLWMTTQGNGLVSVKNQEFKSFGKEHNLLHLYRGLLVDKTDKIWAASSDKGWFYVENGTVNFINYTSSLKNIEVRSIVQSKSGAIWFATLGEGIFKYENDKLISYKVKDGLLDNWAYSLYADEKDRLWIGTSKGLCLFDGKEFHHPYSAINNTVNCITKDMFGDMWLGTIEGLYRIKAFSGKIEFIDSENGLPNDFINDFIFDTEGNLWMTHYKGGLVQINDGKFTNYTSNGGLPGKVVNTIFELDSLSFLIGLDDGKLIQITNGEIESYKVISDIEGNRIRHVMKDSNGTLWVSSYFGLLTISSSGNQKWVSKSTGFKGTKIRLSFEDSRGNIWVGTRNNGLIKISPDNTLKNFNVSNGLTSNLIMSIDEDLEGNIWVGTSEGTSCLNRISKNDNISNFNNHDGFISDIVFNITCTKDSLVWFSTDNGVWVYLNNKFQNINAKNGLCENEVFDMLEDDFGSFWLPFSEGIMKVRKQDIIDVLNDKIKKFNCRVYNKYDGLPNSECNPTAQALKGGNGKLYFATLDGVSVIEPGKTLVNNFIPPVIIENLEVDNQLEKISNNLIFEPGKKRFTFKYTALSFYEPAKISFEYQLEGFENTWNQSFDRVVSYTNLAHGDYTFKVRACNNDGVWNTVGASLPFTIKPKFTETVLFYILILITSFSSVYLFYWWRIADMRKQQEILENTVEARTHEVIEKNKKLNLQKSEIQNQNQTLLVQKAEIEKQTIALEKQQEELKQSIQSKDKIFSIISHDLRSPLGNIQNMLNLLVDKGEQFDEAKKGRILENLSEITKSTFYLLDNLLNWSRTQRGLINHEPQMFLAEPIVKEILALTKPLALRKKICVVSKINESDLAYGDINMVNTIFRNLIENAIKFSMEKGHIEINSNIQDEFIEFAVKDKGVGMSEEVMHQLMHTNEINATFGTNKEKGSGLGLLICKEFIKRNGGVFRIESKPNEGSTFYFTLKRFQI